MCARTPLWLSVYLLFSVSASAWELDTLSPRTFTPLKVGNEWVYFDSSWLEVSADASKKASTDSLVRTVRITGSFMTGGAMYWVATVDVKGMRKIRNPEGNVMRELRDTSFTDTLSMPPNGFFAPSTDSRLISWGMIALFPWFGFEAPCTSSSDFGITTTIGLENQCFGDSIMKISGSTHQLYGNEVTGIETTHTESEITVLAEVGMVVGTRQYYSLANNLYRINTMIRSFNGRSIDPALYAIAVVRPFASHRSNHPAAADRYGRILIMRTRGTEYARYTLQGRLAAARTSNAAGVMIRKRDIVSGR